MRRDQDQGSLRTTSRRWRWFRAAVLVAVDAAAWAAALMLTTWARLEFEVTALDNWGVATVAMVAVGAQVVWGVVAGLYPGRWRLGSFYEAGAVGIGGVIIGVALVGWMVAVADRLVPMSVAIAGPAVFVLFALAPRFVARWWRERQARSHHHRPHRALIYGAGEAGHEVADALLRDPNAELLPVGYLDDDPRKQRLRVNGCRVLGDRAALPRVARTVGADTVVVAMPSAGRAAVAAVAREARTAGLEVLIVPPLARMLSTGIDPMTLRQISFSDFLGRDPVRLDVDAMADFVANRRVLVTGAGGSIGSHLCAAITRFDPKALFMLDRDENALHATQLRLEGRALLDSDCLVVGNIRDQRRLHAVFEQCTPEVVFHAAALKHVSFLERYPDEAVKTNVLGTANVLAAAALVGVDRFVNVSTDKAADPVNVLGMTKRIGEMLTAWYADNGMESVSVRFGNVLGSSGSVVPIFREQIRRGGPVTVTDPEVTRFFMTIEEAAFLVVNAAALAGDGEVMVLDMGDPVRIVDLARSLIDELAPGSDIEVVFTGLRPGEKLHEVLVGAGDRPLGRRAEGINGYAVPPLPPDILEGLDPDDVATLRDRLGWIIDRFASAVRTTHDLD